MCIRDRSSTHPNRIPPHPHLIPTQIFAFPFLASYHSLTVLWWWIFFRKSVVTSVLFYFQYNIALSPTKIEKRSHYQFVLFFFSKSHFNKLVPVSDSVRARTTVRLYSVMFQLTSAFLHHAANNGERRFWWGAGSKQRLQADTGQHCSIVATQQTSGAKIIN